jgi:hypothetical protein
MEDSARTLIVLLSMHRSGSSLTASVLERLGMSLGPFELNGAMPSNPYGHFEAMPFLELNRQVQELAFGFPDDLPDSPTILSRLIKSQGQWPADVAIPEDLVNDGRSLVRALIASGEISGFKDPRTVLTWPFWERVFQGLAGLRVVPLSLLRSPHEIAMSLVTRRNGWVGYWTALDVVAVHFRRQKVILESWTQPPPGLCFGSPSFLDRVVDVTRQCGLTWNPNKALEVFDRSCVHHAPAVVHHEAQTLFQSLLPDPTPVRATEKNELQLAKDARHLEDIRLEQFRTLAQKLDEAREQEIQSCTRADRLAEQLRESEARLNESRLATLHVQCRLIESQSARHEIQERLIRSQAQELHVWQQNGTLRSRLDRYEAHPILGPAIRGRRRLRLMLHSIGGSSAKTGEPDWPQVVA